MNYRQTYTLFKRGKYYYYQTYTPDGVRTSAKTTHCTSKALAKNYCDDLLKRGVLYSGASITFSQFATGFFDYGSIWVQDRLSLGTAERPGISEGTLDKYQRDLKNYLLPFFGNYKMQDINPTLVKKFRQWCIEEVNLSNKSINNAVGCFRLIADSALADSIMMFDPLRGIKALKTDTDTRHAFTLEQAKKALDPNLWENKTAWLCSLTSAVTGMRISELLAIRTNTLHENYIDVKDQRINYKLKPCKTAEKRIVPIPYNLYLRLKESCEGTGFAFELQQNSAYYYLVQTLEKAEIDKKAEKLTFHSWRHFANTYYLANNIPKVKVNAIIGHTDDETKAQKMYTHFAPENLEDFYSIQKSLYEFLLG